MKMGGIQLISVLGMEAGISTFYIYLFIAFKWMSLLDYSLY